MNEHMSTDPWYLGRQYFAKKDVLKMCAEGECRRVKKSILQQAILQNTKASASERSEVVVEEEMDGLLQWQL